MPQKSEVTILLDRISRGDGKAPEELLPLVYDELRRPAQGYMRNERGDHTLQATALVHEAYIRLVDWEKVSWQNRAHFFAMAASVMRKILIDHARQKKSAKTRVWTAARARRSNKFFSRTGSRFNWSG